MSTPHADAVERMPAEVRRMADRPLAGLSLPHDVRAALADVVTAILVDTPLRERYIARWREGAAHPPLPVEVEEQIDAVELRAEEVCREGVGVLADHELVALAARPHDLELMADLILELEDTPDLGDAWKGPLKEAGRRAAHAIPPELVERLAAVTRGLGTGGPTVPAATTQRKQFFHPAALAALAAALIVGIGLGVGGHRLLSTGGRSDEWAALSSGSELSRLQPRGGDVSFEVKLDSPRPGFAAVVVPRAGEKPRVYPEGWDDPPRAAPGAAATYGPLDARAGQAVLVVVTETPAADVLRRAFEKGPAVESVEALRTQAEAALKANGFRWAAFAVVELK